MTNNKQLQSMNIPEATAANDVNTLVTADELARLDEYYAKRRLPEATPVGAEDRTFCFRVEFEHDLFPLSHMLRWATETWWSSPLCPWGDADVKMTLKPDTLTLAEVRWLLARVVDCHVALETVELERDYTGNRKYSHENDLDVKVPRSEALMASVAGLAHYRDALSIAEERALDAEAEIESELHRMESFREHVFAHAKRNSQPVSITLAGSERASS